MVNEYDWLMVYSQRVHLHSTGCMQNAGSATSCQQEWATKLLRKGQLCWIGIGTRVTRMWANAQRDGRPAEHRLGGALCSTPQSLADAHYLTAVQ